jgi:hypothetical protein
MRDHFPEDARRWIAKMTNAPNATPRPKRLVKLRQGCLVGCHFHSSTISSNRNQFIYVFLTLILRICIVDRVFLQNVRRL